MDQIDNKNNINNDSSKEETKISYRNIRFFPVNILDAIIISFLGIGLILAIFFKETTLSATIAGVFGGYIKSASSITNNKN